MVRPCVFVGSSRKEVSILPDEVRMKFGHALFQAQCGDEPLSAKALKGFGGRGVLELVEDSDGNAYRAVYTVRYPEAVYVLHAFQKKSRKGIATPKHVLDRVRLRLADVEVLHRAAIFRGG